MTFSLSSLLSVPSQFTPLLHRVLLQTSAFLLSLSPPPPLLPVTLLKLPAIQVALVMLIGLAMAYAYPPSRVWALIRAKQSPADPSCSTRTSTNTPLAVFCFWSPEMFTLVMCGTVRGLALHRRCQRLKRTLLSSPARLKTNVLF